MTSWLADFPDRTASAAAPHRPRTGRRKGADARAHKPPEPGQGVAPTQDERLELYGRVDRLLVAEWVLLVPVAYLRTTLLRRPWVHGLWANTLTPFRLDGVIVDREHQAQPGAGG